MIELVLKEKSFDPTSEKMVPNGRIHSFVADTGGEIYHKYVNFMIQEKAKKKAGLAAIGKQMKTVKNKVPKENLPTKSQAEAILKKLYKDKDEE